MDILEVLNTTATTITARLGDGEQFATGLTVSLYDNTKTTVLQTVNTDENGEVVFSGLTPETRYYAYYQAAGYVDALTTADSAKTALETQWSDLASRVKEAQAGGIKTLTTADYNWPTSGTKTRLNLGTLKQGIYRIDNNGAYDVIFNGRQFQIGGDNDLLIVIGAPNTGGRHFLCGSIPAGDVSLIDGQYSNGCSKILAIHDIVDNLISTSARLPLSAAQGKVLNEKIEGRIIQNAGTPTTSTIGTVGMLLEDTTNGKLYQCTAIDDTDPQAIVYTWTEVGGSSGPTVVQTTGTSTTDVMSQNAVTAMVYPYFSSTSTNTKYSIAIGDGITKTTGSWSPTNLFVLGKNILIDHNNNNQSDSVGIGNNFRLANASICIGSGTGIGNSDKVGSSSITIGGVARASGMGAIALGYGSRASTAGEMNIGTSYSYAGYNSSNYRKITGVYDGENAHDAVNKGQLDTAIINGGTAAPTTSTVGVVGTQYTYVDTTGTPIAHLCVCTEVDTTDPSNPVHTWQTLI